MQSKDVDSPISGSKVAHEIIYNGLMYCKNTCSFYSLNIMPFHL